MRTGGTVTVSSRTLTSICVRGTLGLGESERVLAIKRTTVLMTGRKLSLKQGKRFRRVDSDLPASFQSVC